MGLRPGICGRESLRGCHRALTAKHRLNADLLASLLEYTVQAKASRRAKPKRAKPATKGMLNQMLNQIPSEIDALGKSLIHMRGTLSEGGKRGRMAARVVEGLRRMVQETVQGERVSSAELKALVPKLRDQLPQTCAAIMALPDEVTLAEAIGYAKLISGIAARELAAN
jgi:hypothetical protein